jgi:twitching motility protein PilT
VTTLRDETESLIEQALQAGASDLLLSDGVPPMIRLAGDLHPLTGAPVLDAAAVAEHVDALLGPEQRQQFGTDREVDFSFSWNEVARVRGNAFHQRGTPALALRIIPLQIPTCQQIGIPVVVREAMRLRQGLILVTGPTGAGKSTTQAALIDWVNRERACHVLTLEDPLEYVHSHRRSVVNQRQIGFDSPSFAHALRAALREDPDVLLVGEMRDPESISIALTIAETGHLVLSTLHTNDTAQAVDRIVDVFPGERQAQVRVQLAGSLTAVVAQRLVPRIGGGMVAAFEVLLANHAVRNLIREGKSRQIRNVVSTGGAEGMMTLEHSLSRLVEAGVVSYEDALSRSTVPGEVEHRAPSALLRDGRR